MKLKRRLGFCWANVTRWSSSGVFGGPLRWLSAPRRRGLPEPLANRTSLGTMGTGIWAQLMRRHLQIWQRMIDSELAQFCHKMNWPFGNKRQQIHCLKIDVSKNDYASFLSFFQLKNIHVGKMRSHKVSTNWLKEKLSAIIQNNGNPAWYNNEWLMPSE